MADDRHRACGDIRPRGEPVERGIEDFERDHVERPVRLASRGVAGVKYRIAFRSQLAGEDVAAFLQPAFRPAEQQDRRTRSVARSGEEIGRRVAQHHAFAAGAGFGDHDRAGFAVEPHECTDTDDRQHDHQAPDPHFAACTHSRSPVPPKANV